MTFKATLGEIVNYADRDILNDVADHLGLTVSEPVDDGDTCEPWAGWPMSKMVEVTAPAHAQSPRVSRLQSGWSYAWV